MGGGQNETPVRGQAQPGLDNRYATAADTQNIAHPKGQRHNGGTLYRVTPSAGEPFAFFAKGRVRWALERLCEAGATGCTPMTEPAPRWSAYIFDLREAGLDIETLHEQHHGPYPGTHGRYVLRCDVRRAKP
ncbi:winged helix domain-containing protein [Loktanella sp. M215]|uniref:winged helix domain-containing protein n=1 Tax=Loktanella sp. M215 TaxID=2675431 RepID=UPI001F4433A6|nr:hypothetical protein [Loktanella sp. M215]